MLPISGHNFNHNPNLLNVHHPLPKTPSPTSSNSGSSDSSGSKRSSQRARTWVPLFINPVADPDAPLATSTDLPNTPRREMPPGSSPDGSSSSEDGVASYHSLTSSPHSLHAGRVDNHGLMSPGVGLSSSFAPRSPMLLSSPNVGRMRKGSGSGMMVDSPGGANMRRSPSNASNYSSGLSTPMTGHSRQRSSIMVSMPGLGVAIPSTEVLMERVGSISAFMEDLKTKKFYSNHHKRGGSGTMYYKQQLEEEKKLIWARAVKTLMIFLGTLGGIGLLRSLFLAAAFPPPSSNPSINVARSNEFDIGLPSFQPFAFQFRAPRLPLPAVLTPAFMARPYSLDTHPRTPFAGDKVSFSEYLTTRLGSQYAIPVRLASTAAAKKSEPQLWITTATSESVKITTPHLRAFVHASLGKLVTVCLDEGCEQYCRENDRGTDKNGAEWFCYGGFGVASSLRGKRLEKANEIVKILAATEALESGRRIRLVDSDVFFMEDPAQFMGASSSFDLQITDYWSTAHTNGGFLFANPSKSVISLFRRILELTKLDDDDESYSWRSINLLLDPTGAQRSPPSTSIPDIDDEEEDEVDGYGQPVFQSPWGGGLNVKVLDKRRFRRTKGNPGAVGDAFKIEKKKGKKEVVPVYFQAQCSQDLPTSSYIAATRGYHHPSIAFIPNANPLDVPHFPLMLTTPTTSLNGTSSELNFVFGLLLQLARDTHRAFVPPLKGRFHASHAGIAPKDTFIWRLAPVASWAINPPGDVEVLEPLYLNHATAILASPEHVGKIAGKKSKSDLDDSVSMETSVYPTYKDLLAAVQKPLPAGSRVLILENMAEMMNKEGWKLRDEFRDMDLCWQPEGEVGKKAKCELACRGKPSEWDQDEREEERLGRY